jgi:hypothetical protein
MELTLLVLSLLPDIDDHNLLICGMVLSRRRGREGWISNRLKSMQVEVTLDRIVQGRSRTRRQLLPNLREMLETLPTRTDNVATQRCLRFRTAFNRTV